MEGVAVGLRASSTISATLHLGATAVQGPQLARAASCQSGQVYANFGASVASAGDVDGDGRADVLVGAPRFDGVDADEGRLFLYRGVGAEAAATPGRGQNPAARSRTASEP